MLYQHAYKRKYISYPLILVKINIAGVECKYSKAYNYIVEGLIMQSG